MANSKSCAADATSMGDPCDAEGAGRRCTQSEKRNTNDGAATSLVSRGRQGLWVGGSGRSG